MLGRVAVMTAGIAWTGAAALAADSIPWKSIGDWDISVDTTLENGCYALAIWAGGTVLRIGLNPAADNFYFLVGNPKWGSLKPDQEYEIQIKFGPKPPWDVATRGLQFDPDDSVYLHAQSSEFEFIEEFMRQTDMKISYDGKEIETLKLTGSNKAFKGVLACQDEVATKGVPAQNTFSHNDNKPVYQRPSEDPFAD